MNTNSSLASKVISVILLIVVSLSACADPRDALPTSTQTGWSQSDLEQIIDHWRQEANVPGVVVGISLPGREDILISDGVSSMADQTPMPIDSQFRIASIVKTFIAAEILKLGEQGRVQLDAPISDYLSDVTHGDRITVRQLLSHRSGYFDPVQDDPGFIESIARDMDRHWTWQEYLEQAYQHPLSFDPGSDYQYADTNYLLLGLLIEQLTGQTLGDVLTADFIAPLHLDHTTYETLDTPLSTGRLVHGYAANPADGSLEDILSLPQSALLTISPNLISNASDLLVWLRALYGPDAVVLGHKLQSQMLTFDSISPYGLGVFRSNTAIGVSYGHGGETAGYQSLMQYLPQEDLAIVILVNKGLPSANLDALLESLLNVMFPSSVDSWVDRSIAALKNNDPGTRKDAINALGHGGVAAQKAIPDLILLLESDPVAENRKESALALGLLGKNSEPAKQALIDALQDPDPIVSDAAQLALSLLQ